MLPRKLLQPHGELRHAEQNLYHLQGRPRRSILPIPHEHIGVHRALPCNQPEVRHAHMVFCVVEGAVHGAENIAEAAHPRPVIRLPEFQHNIRLMAF